MSIDTPADLGEAWLVCSAFGMHQLLMRLDPFQAQGAPCFESPANDRDWEFLFGNDPEAEYQP